MANPREQAEWARLQQNAVSVDGFDNDSELNYWDNRPTSFQNTLQGISKESASSLGGRSVSPEEFQNAILAIERQQAAAGMPLPPAAKSALMNWAMGSDIATEQKMLDHPLIPRSYSDQFRRLRNRLQQINLLELQGYTNLPPATLRSIITNKTAKHPSTFKLDSVDRARELLMNEVDTLRKRAQSDATDNAADVTRDVRNTLSPQDKQKAKTNPTLYDFDVT